MGERASCLYFEPTSGTYQLACVDDLCHCCSQTLCGLEHGVDFDVWEDDDYEDDGGDDMGDETITVSLEDLFDVLDGFDLMNASQHDTEAYKRLMAQVHAAETAGGR